MRRSLFPRGLATLYGLRRRHYGALLEGAGADIARRLSAFEATQERAADERTEDV